MQIGSNYPRDSGVRSSPFSINQQLKWKRVPFVRQRQLGVFARAKSNVRFFPFAPFFHVLIFFIRLLLFYSGRVRVPSGESSSSRRYLCCAQRPPRRENLISFLIKAPCFFRIYFAVNAPETIRVASAKDGNIFIINFDATFARFIIHFLRVKYVRGLAYARHVYVRLSRIGYEIMKRSHFGNLQFCIIEKLFWMRNFRVICAQTNMHGN